MEERGCLGGIVSPCVHSPLKTPQFSAKTLNEKWQLNNRINWAVLRENREEGEEEGLDKPAGARGYGGRFGMKVRSMAHFGVEDLGRGGERGDSPAPPPEMLHGLNLLPASHEKYQGLAEAQGYSQERGRIKRVHYSHDAMIDIIVLEPEISQGDLAQRFGYSEVWISRIMGSDAFQAALAKRRDEILDPFLVATVEERLRGLATQSLDVIAKKLQATQSADIALKALDISTKALGFGARDRQGGAIQNNFVIQMPGKAATAEEWASAYGSPMKAVEASSLSTTISRDPLIQPDPAQILED